MMNTLPIDTALPALRTALLARDEVVLEAPPDAGKTTRVPLALLSEPWLGSQKILMLEPWRLAARAAAERLASELGERVGETVGFRASRTWTFEGFSSAGSTGLPSFRLLRNRGFKSYLVEVTDE